MPIANMIARERISVGALLRGCIALLGLGILWGWAWFSTVHLVPYFYVIAPIADVIVYGVVGVWVRLRLSGYALSFPSLVTLAVLATLSFYIGNRIIWLLAIAGSWPFTYDGHPEAGWVYEASVLVVGIVAASRRGS